MLRLSIRLPCARSPAAVATRKRWSTIPGSAPASGWPPSAGSRASPPGCAPSRSTGAASCAASAPARRVSPRPPSPGRPRPREPGKMRVHAHLRARTWQRREHFFPPPAGVASDGGLAPNRAGMGRAAQVAGRALRVPCVPPRRAAPPSRISREMPARRAQWQSTVASRTRFRRGRRRDLLVLETTGCAEAANSSTRISSTTSRARRGRGRSPVAAAASARCSSRFAEHSSQTKREVSGPGSTMRCTA